MNFCALFSILKSLLFLIPVVLNLAAQKNRLESFLIMLTPAPHPRPIKLGSLREELRHSRGTSSPSDSKVNQRSVLVSLKVPT